MKDLIEVWEKRANRYSDLARNETNNFALERLYASAGAYSLCADELKRKIASQPVVEADACPKCGGELSFGLCKDKWICTKCGAHNRSA